MKKVNLADIGGMEFPAGRRTRVLVGENAPLEAERFVMGHVTLYPGGSVPPHEHAQEEVYFIVSGCGRIVVDDASSDVSAGDCIYIPSQAEHSLENTSDHDMVMMFCYAPKTVAEHWAQELQGRSQANQAASSGES